MIVKLRERWRGLRRSRRGLSAVETAITVPVILVAIAVGYDLASFGKLQNRVRETAFRVADAAASDEGLASGGLLSSVGEMRATARLLLVPNQVCDVASVVLSGVTNAGGRGQVIAWQEKWHYPTPNGGGDCVGIADARLVSGLGSVGAAPDFAAVLPNQSVRALAVRDKDSAIIAEIVYRDVRRFLPQVLVNALPSTLYGTAAARVRGQIP